jgi:hypothetical protein
VYGDSTNGSGVRGQTAGGASVGGVYGQSTGPIGNGVYGTASNGPLAAGVFGFSSGGYGLLGESSSGYGAQGTSVTNWGIKGEGASGVWGVAIASNGTGLSGQSPVGIGVRGTTGGGNTVSALSGESTGANGVGVAGLATNGAVALGVWGSTTGGRGVYGSATTGTGVYGSSSTGYAGWFDGNVNVTGSCCAMGAAYTRIDHPLEPEDKYLDQALVQSPDMLTTINGNATTDGKGEAVVSLPAWFQAANSDFRYQLTVVGQFAQAIVSEKVKNNRFSIKTDKGNVEVSWQVTGVRSDPYARAQVIEVESAKAADERGKYRYPTEWGQPESSGIDYGKSPVMQPPAPDPLAPKPSTGR